MKTYSDDSIVAAMLSTRTNREAAQLLGMNERYLYTRLQEKPLQAKLEAARANLTHEVASHLRQSLTNAVTVLSDIMNDETASAQTRVNAANSIISNYLKITERDAILNRLEAIENEL